MANARLLQELMKRLVGAKKLNQTPGKTADFADITPDPARQQELVDFEQRMTAGMVHDARGRLNEAQQARSSPVARSDRARRLKEQGYDLDELDADSPFDGYNDYLGGVELNKPKLPTTAAEVRGIDNLSQHLFDQLMKMEVHDPKLLAELDARNPYLGDIVRREFELPSLFTTLDDDIPF